MIYQPQDEDVEIEARRLYGHYANCIYVLIKYERAWTHQYVRLATDPEIPAKHIALGNDGMPVHKL